MTFCDTTAGFARFWDSEEELHKYNAHNDLRLRSLDFTFIGFFSKNPGTRSKTRCNCNKHSGLRCPTRDWDKLGHRDTPKMPFLLFGLLQPAIEKVTEDDRSGFAVNEVAGFF